MNEWKIALVTELMNVVRELQEWNVEQQRQNEEKSPTTPSVQEVDLMQQLKIHECDLREHMEARERGRFTIVGAFAQQRNRDR